MMRAATSGGPPGPNGTISLIGFSGKLSATAAAGRPSAIAAASATGLYPAHPRAIELVIDLSRPRQSWYRLIVVSSMATASTRHLNAQAALHLFVHCAKGRQSSVVSANPLKIGANQRGAIACGYGSRNGAAMDIFLGKESGPNRSSKGLPMTQTMSQFLLGYLPLVVFIGVSTVIGLVLLTVAFLVAYKQPDPEKLSAYECGFNAFDDARMKFDIRFYLVAILFIIFDLE